MEDAGRIRRGYFVAGLGAAQFAMPAALDLLRSLRDAPDEPRTVVLAATDPANPYGTILKWPDTAAGTSSGAATPAGDRRGRSARSVILVDGQAAAYLRRGERELLLFVPEDEPQRSRVVREVARTLLAPGGRARGRTARHAHRRDQRRAATAHPAARLFIEEGFAATAMGLQARVVAPALRGSAAEVRPMADHATNGSRHAGQRATDTTGIRTSSDDQDRARTASPATAYDDRDHGRAGTRRRLGADVDPDSADADIDRDDTAERVAVRDQLPSGGAGVDRVRPCLKATPSSVPPATLHRALAGRTVTRFETVFPQLTRVDDDTPLRGRVVERVDARGKHLLIWFSGDLVLRTHMRMHGSWHVYRPGERWQRPRHDMRIVAARRTTFDAVGFNIPIAEFLAASDVERTRRSAALGPDPLATRLRRRPRPSRRLAARGDMEIADALLDQRAIAGIGNVYKSEIAVRWRASTRSHGSPQLDARPGRRDRAMALRCCAPTSPTRRRRHRHLRRPAPHDRSRRSVGAALGLRPRAASRAAAAVRRSRAKNRGRTRARRIGVRSASSEQFEIGESSIDLGFG